MLPPSSAKAACSLAWAHRTTSSEIGQARETMLAGKAWKSEEYKGDCEAFAHPRRIS